MEIGRRPEVPWIHSAEYCRIGAIGFGTLDRVRSPPQKIEPEWLAIPVRTPANRSEVSTQQPTTRNEPDWLAIPVGKPKDACSTANAVYKSERYPRDDESDTPDELRLKYGEEPLCYARTAMLPQCDRATARSDRRDVEHERTRGLRQRLWH
jgi:hypothetical protein